jgi:hypothetical protein
VYFSINQIIKVDIVIERNKNPIKDCRGIIKKNICNCGISLDNIPPPILIKLGYIYFTLVGQQFLNQNGH